MVKTYCISTDPKQLYNDTGQDNGHFLEHVGNEAKKAASLNPLDTSIFYEAHPKMKQFPFQGPHLFSVIGRTTEAKPPNANLVVSFHFRVRTGCTVEVVSNDSSSVKVYVAMNSVGYTPPALPARKDVNYSLSDIDKALGELETSGASLAAILFGALYQNPLSLNALSLPKGLLVLLRGVTSDKYAALPPADCQNPGLPGAVIQAQLTAVPAGQGVTVDSTQPYPLTGWIEVRWSRFDGYVRFRNVWQTTECITSRAEHRLRGRSTPGSGAQIGFCRHPLRRTVTRLETVYWIQNRWQSNQRLNVESGKLDSSVAQDGWLSARWTFEPVAGTDQYQIRNVWQRTQYLNIESGALAAGPIQPGWLSARWTTEQVV